MNHLKLSPLGTWSPEAKGATQTRPPAAYSDSRSRLWHLGHATTLVGYCSLIVLLLPTVTVLGQSSQQATDSAAQQTKQATQLDRTKHVKQAAQEGQGEREGQAGQAKADRQSTAAEASTEVGGVGSRTAEASAAFDVTPHVEAFDEVWQTIRSVHWNPDLVGEAWEAARAEYRPRVVQAENAAQARAAIEELLQSLGQSHCGIIPGDSYSAIERQSRRGGPGVIGIRLRYIDDGVVVTQVRSGSSAEEEGVKCGWRLLDVTKGDDRVTTAEVISDVREAVEHQVIRFDTMLGLAADGLVSADVDEELQLTFLDHADQEVHVVCRTRPAPGKVAQLGHLPSFHVEFKASVLPDNIGYISFNAFLDPFRLIQSFEQAVTEDFAECRGLVIDLRGNRGGLLVLAMGMSGWFVEETVSLGEMTMKNTPLQLNINPREPRWERPIALLIDECSISAAELYAGGLMDLNLAKSFGQTTAGLVLPSTVSKLPNGDGFQYVLADYHSASGKALEGAGVIPDQPIQLSRDLLRRDADPVLSAAKAWITSQAAQR